MLENIRNSLWGLPTVLLIATLGFFIMIHTKFFVQRKLLKIVKNTFLSSLKDKSSLMSVFCALGGTVGVGNTVGVAGAICEAGAGAIFWMLVASFFGM